MKKTRKSYSRAISIALALMLMFSVIQAACVAAGAGEVDFASISAGDSFENAQQISVNTSYTDNLASSSEVDYYKFTLSSNAMIAVKFSHTHLDSSSTYWVVRIYKSDDLTTDLLKFDVKGNNMNSTSPSTGLAPGNYYVKISDYSFNSMDYTFSLDATVSDYWEKEYNNEYTSASYVEVNKEYSGSLMNSDDIDYYYFTLSSPAMIAIDFSHTIIESSSTYWIVEIYTDELKKIERVSVTGNEADLVFPSVGLPAGKYYIKVQDYSTSTIDYHFTLGCTVSDYWEKEINDEFVSASAMILNSTYHGSLCTTDDIDYFKFSLSSNSKVSLDFVHELFDSSSTYWKIHLYDSSYDEIMNTKSVGKDNIVTTPNIGLPAGDYYIKIIDYTYIGIDYSITVNSEKASNWETELNNDYNKGDIVQFNTAYYGSICDTDDVDYYRFTLEKEADVSINFEHEFFDSSSTYWSINLYDTNGNQKLSFGSAGNKSSVSSSTVSLPEGDYYFKITDYSYNGMDYKFVVNGPESKPSKLLGDADGDGKVASPDATLIQRRLAEISVSFFDGEGADVDGDNSLTIVDAAFIQRWLAQISIPYNIGDPIK